MALDEEDDETLGLQAVGGGRLSEATADFEAGYMAIDVTTNNAATNFRETRDN